jgi:hypothetical protein
MRSKEKTRRRQTMIYNTQKTKVWANYTKTRGENPDASNRFQMLLIGKQYLLHLWPLSCHSRYYSGGRSYSVISHEQEKNGIWRRQTEQIRDHLWHGYFVMVNQFMVTTVTFYLMTNNPWFSSFIVSSNPLTWQSQVQ